MIVFGEDNVKYQLFIFTKHMLNIKSINEKVFTVKEKAVLNYYRFMLIHIYSQQHVLAWN